MEKEDIPVATIKVDSVNGSDVAVESAGWAEPVLSPEALDELMAKVEANGLELLGPDGVLADLTKRIIERALDDERTHHLGYERGDPAGRGSGNSRNGVYAKAVLTDIGAVDIEVPRDRNGTFEPKLVPPHSSRLAGFNERIVSLYAGGMTVRDIRRHLKQIYGIEVSPDLISTVTDGIVEELNEWQTRALDPVYPIMYIDALVVKVRDQGTVVNKPAYQVIGVDVEGRKHVLGIWMGDGDEGAKFWLAVLTEVKNRGVADVLIVCCDGLKGLPDAIETTWPQAVVQTCVIHLIRGSTRYCSYKDRKAVAQALRPIYTAVNEEAAAEALDDFELMWGDRYPGIVRLWRSAWERFTPFLAYPAELRKIVYTTNLIESVNFQLRKVSKNRGHFPNDAAALKLLRLVARDITTTRGGAAGTGTYAWKTALNILDIHFPNRLVFNT
jgi:putative transposase